LVTQTLSPSSNAIYYGLLPTEYVLVAHTEDGIIPPITTKKKKKIREEEPIIIIRFVLIRCATS
jgi:hypothetical protein